MKMTENIMIKHHDLMIRQFRYDKNYCLASVVRQVYFKGACLTSGLRHEMKISILGKFWLTLKIILCCSMSTNPVELTIKIN